MNLFRFVPGYETSIYEAGREPIFVALVAFLICFSITRGYTRVARVRGWGSGSVHGVHLHHVVVGIVLALVSATLIIGFEPVDNFFELFLCAVFGSGAALILDEFALVFRLQDVYWSEEGRSSIDAVIVAVTLGALVLLHVTPFDVDTAEDPTRWSLMVIVGIHVVLVCIVLLKGKLWTGLFGLFVPMLALIGAVRLAKPNSPWARRLYGPESRRRHRAEARYRKHDDRWAGRQTRALDLIGGAPSEREAK
ncbi:MAG: hypothetical protein ACRDNG_09885 [Gaiellaceae bacterium]